MLPAHNTKIAWYLISQSQLLGIVKAGGIFRLFCFDELRLDLEAMDIHGNEWAMDFEEFADDARVFNHEDYPEFVEFYPQSANQMMLEMVWKGSTKISTPLLGELARTFKPVQYGRIKKD